MESKDIKRYWWELDRPLVTHEKVKIDEMIRKAEIRLFNLEEEKRAGVKVHNTTKTMTEIKGIPLKFHKDRKTVSLKSDRSVDPDKYDREMDIVSGELAFKGFKKKVCSVSMKSEGVQCK